MVIDVNSFLQDLLAQTGLAPITYITSIHMRTSSYCTYIVTGGEIGETGKLPFEKFVCGK